MEGGTVFKDGSRLEFDCGKFDRWCVYLTRPGQERSAPSDREYFARFAEYAEKYGARQIYADFVSVYDRTGKVFDPAVPEAIKQKCSQSYGDDATDIAIDLTSVYMGMLAEQNKEHTKLGKRIKRLGLYQVLLEHMPPDLAASFSRGKNWREIDGICRSKGF